MSLAASELVEMGDIPAAIALADRFSRSDDKMRVYLRIANQKISEDGPIAAKPYLDQALLSAQSFNSKFGTGSNYMAMIVGCFVNFRFFGEARQIANEIEDVVEKAEAWIKIAVELITFHYEKALEAVTIADRTIACIEDSIKRAELIYQRNNFGITRDQKKAKIDEALNILSTVDDTTETIRQKAWIYKRISNALAYFEESVKVLRLINDREIRCEFSECIEYELISAGLYDDALLLFREDDIPVPEKEDRLSMMADYMLERTDINDTMRLLDIAETPRGRAFILAAVAEYMVENEENRVYARISG